MVSALLHVLMMWLPSMSLPKQALLLPPLQAKLEALPKASAQLVQKKIKPKSREKPVKKTQEIAEESVIPILPPDESAPPITSAVAEAETMAIPASAPAMTEAPLTIPTNTTTVGEAIVETPRPLLPLHARLLFNVYQGEGNFKVGESLHELDISGGRYTLKADVRTTGLVGMIKSYRLAQMSVGVATKSVLKPELFTEDVIDSNGRQSNRAEFDWANLTLHFARGGEAKLSDDAQDILSILYQFPVMKQNQQVVPINIATGKQFETYRFEIAFEEKIETAMGTLQTVHFRKLHADKEEGLEIWFAQEYRLLPVKLRHIDRDGKVTAEAVISSIRVSDE